MRHRTQASPRIALGCALLAPVMVLTACGDSSHPLSADPYDAADQVTVSAGGSDAADRRTVDPTKPLEITADHDDQQITDVVVVDDAGRRVAGELSADGSRWRSTGDLAAGSTYSVRVSTENPAGRQGRSTVSFGTRAPGAKDKRLKLALGPESGTYGVGQPITAELSRAVRNVAERRVVEGALTVRSTPRVTGSWHWVDDRKLHYRPQEYWPSGADITVESKLAGLQIRKGLYGDATKPLKLRTGDRVEAIADAGSYTMSVKRNGEVIRTIPITTGKAGFRTRTGTKVVLGRESFVRMRSTSIGIGEGSPDFYDLPVYWATRLTWSGEYVHGAPWSTGSHGAANVSHGCTGMSSDNARWFYNTIRPGDLVTHTNTQGEAMATFGNGFGDWNMSWEEWRKGSALTPGAPGGEQPAERPKSADQDTEPRQAAERDAERSGAGAEAGTADAADDGTEAEEAAGGSDKPRGQSVSGKLRPRL